MKKKLVTCLIAIFCLTLGTSISTQAFAKDLPVSKQSQQWQVTMGKAKTNHQNNVYNRYHYHSLTIKNLGTTVSNVKVTGFKESANVHSNVVTTLSDKKLSKGNVIESKDFPLFFNTNKFIVIISWTKDNNEKKQEKFVFTK